MFTLLISVQIEARVQNVRLYLSLKNSKESKGKNDCSYLFLSTDLFETPWRLCKSLLANYNIDSLFI